MFLTVLVAITLILCVFNAVLLIGVAGTLAKVVEHLAGPAVEPERKATVHDRQVTYAQTFLMGNDGAPNWDGIPRGKNWDGVPIDQ